MKLIPSNLVKIKIKSLLSCKRRFASRRKGMIISMLLKDVCINKSYMVVSLQVNDNVKRRLEALGMIHNTKIRILNSKKNGSVIFSVRGTRLAVGKSISEKIMVKECEGNE